MKRGLLAHVSTTARVITIISAFFVGACFSFIGTAVVIALFESADSTQSILNTAEGMRMIQSLSAVFLFTFPPLLAEWLLSPSPAEALSLNRPSLPFDLWMGVGCLVVAIPFISWIEELNRAVSFPASMAGLEQWFLSKEEEAKYAIEVITQGHSWGHIVSSFLVIAVLAGVSEEILFRGFIQNRLARWRHNSHFAVWVTAFIFSAIHIQFYGFLPRLLLGAFLGYLLVWSRSLWLPIVVHVVNNGLYLLFQLLTRKKVISFDLEQFKWSEHGVWLALSILLTVCAVVLYGRRMRARTFD